MSEKALSIATYCAASGAHGIMGVTNTVKGGQEVQRRLSEGWRERVGGRLEFTSDAEEIATAARVHIDERRAALKLPTYDATKWGASGDARMNRLMKSRIEERIDALWGAVLAGRISECAGSIQEHGGNQPAVGS